MCRAEGFANKLNATRAATLILAGAHRPDAARGIAAATDSGPHPRLTLNLPRLRTRNPAGKALGGGGAD